jgi:hypothetical protein
VVAEHFEEICALIMQVSLSQMTRERAEEIYSHAKNTLTMPELDSVVSTHLRQIKIKTLSVNLPLFRVCSTTI